MNSWQKLPSKVWCESRRVARRAKEAVPQLLLPFKRRNVQFFSQFVVTLIAIVVAAFFGWEQLHINEHLLDLNYIPEVNITYDGGAEIINVVNEGNTSITFLGSKLDTQPAQLAAPPLIVSPHFYHRVHVQGVENEIRAQLGNDGQRDIWFNAYIETENHKRYVVRGLLVFVMVKGGLRIDAQMLSVLAGDWSK